MNIVNKILLKIVLAPSKIYSNWGISIPQLEAILQFKLLMDDRRPSAIMQTRQRANKKTKKISRATIGTMIVSAVMGCFFLIVFGMGQDNITHFTLYFSMFITFLCMTLISDFTSVLIDVRDNYIILPKPVNDSTFVLARLLHILIHTCKILLPMAIPAILYVGFHYLLIAAVLFLFLILLATLFSLFLINAIYIIILQLTTPEKFKNIISYIQIFFAISIYAASQLLPRLLGKTGMQQLNVAHSKWLIIAPPYWFACAFNSLFTLHASSIERLGSLASLTLPLLSVYIVVKYLAPSFNQKLSMITGSDGATKPVTKTTLQQQKSIGNSLANIVTTHPTEKMGFLFSWKLMARSRDFKVKVYPSIGYIIVIIVMMLLNDKKGVNMQDFRSENARSVSVIIFSIYLSSILVLTAITQITYSEKFKAAWIFFIVPLSHPGKVISGSIKAMLFQFYIIVALILIVVAAILGGPSIIPNIILGICNQLVIIYTIIAIGYRSLPFSKSATMAQKSGQFIRTLSMLLISGAIGLLHFFIYKNVIAILLVFIVSLGLLYFLLKNIKQTSWQQLKMIEADGE